MARPTACRKSRAPLIQLHEEASLPAGSLRWTVILRDAAGHPLATGSVADGEYRIRFPGLATFAFRPGEANACFTAAPTTPRHVVDDLFLTAALPLMLQVAGCEALHASAVQMAGGVFAFCGFSGTGKTTFAYGLTRRGHTLYADDVVALSTTGGEPRIYTSPLPYTVNLRPESRRLFGLEANAEISPPPRDTERERLATLVVLAPELDTEIEMTRLSIDVAFAALLPHAFCFFAEPRCAQRAVSAYLDVVAQVPVFRLRFPRNPACLNRALDVLEAHFAQTVVDA